MPRFGRSNRVYASQTGIDDHGINDHGMYGHIRHTRGDGIRRRPQPRDASRISNMYNYTRRGFTDLGRRASVLGNNTTQRMYNLGSNIVRPIANYSRRASSAIGDQFRRHKRIHMIDSHSNSPILRLRSRPLRLPPIQEGESENSPIEIRFSSSKSPKSPKSPKSNKLLELLNRENMPLRKARSNTTPRRKKGSKKANIRVSSSV